MSAHLSDLALDALAEAPDGGHPHLAECSACSERLGSFRRTRERALRDPRFEQLQASLEPRRRRGFGGLGLALAAGLVLAAVGISMGHPMPSRLKGAASLRLVALEGTSGRFHPGQHVALEVGGAGHPFVLVLGRDARGKVSQIWPTQGDRSGALAPGAGVRLRPAFEVTPGALHLVALFSDVPLSATDVLGAWRVSAAASPPPISGEAARATAELDVEDAT